MKVDPNEIHKDTSIVSKVRTLAKFAGKRLQSSQISFSTLKWMAKVDGRIEDFLIFGLITPKRKMSYELRSILQLSEVTLHFREVMRQKRTQPKPKATWIYLI